MTPTVNPTRTMIPDGTLTNPIQCDDWTEAFSITRDRDIPTVCSIPHRVFGLEVARLFPNGRAVFIRYERPQPATRTPSSPARHEIHRATGESAIRDHDTNPTEAEVKERQRVRAWLD